jgi:hypothetical protein
MDFWFYFNELIGLSFQLFVYWLILYLALTAFLSAVSFLRRSR